MSQPELTLSQEKEISDELGELTVSESEVKEFVEIERPTTPPLADTPPPLEEKEEVHTLDIREPENVLKAFGILNQMVNSNSTRISKLEAAMNFVVGESIAFEQYVNDKEQHFLKIQERLDKLEDTLQAKENIADEKLQQSFERVKKLDKKILQGNDLLNLLETRIANVTKEWQHIKSCNEWLVRKHAQEQERPYAGPSSNAMRPPNHTNLPKPNFNKTAQTKYS